MPTFFLDTPDILPLPSLQAYTTISVLLLSCSIYYAFQVTSEPDWKLNATLSLGLNIASNHDPGDLDINGDSSSLNNNNNNNPIISEYHGTLSGMMSASGNNETSVHLGLLLENPMIVRSIDVLFLMLHEPLCIWTLINMAYCCLILVGKLIQKMVFGELRVSEQQHMKDRFWNFVFYKFIFIFGVMNVQYMDEVVLWTSWFSVLGFLCLLTQLCKDRFEYLSFSPMTPKGTHLKLILLLTGIFVSSMSLFIICVLVGLHSGFNTFAFMSAECSLVAVRTLYVMVRYGVHLWDLNYEGVWENRASYAYYSELMFELSILAIDFMHHLHMLFWGNIILSMASLVILMQLRFLFYEIKRRIRKHKNYLQVVQLMEANFPMATTEDLDKNSDDCAICWDRMEVARKLPCGHLFHNSCLRSWLEQDTSCPTCRTSLKGRGRDHEMHHHHMHHAHHHHDHLHHDHNHTDARHGPNRGAQNATRFFHFDGSRYASWLPTVSVEVSRPHLLSMSVITGHHHHTQQNEHSMPSSPTSSTATSRIVIRPNPQLENMAQQVQEWFPHVQLSSILEDLQNTRSVEVTMENILDGRLDASTSEPSVDPTNDVFLPSASSRNSYARGSSPEPSDSVSSQPSSPSPSFDQESRLINDSCDELPKVHLEEDEEFHDTSPKVFGGRFSKSPEERIQILHRRKEDLVKAARKMYINKHKQSPSSDPN